MAFASIREVIVNINEEFRISPDDTVVSIIPTGINQYKIIILTFLRKD